jgi:hypothetical protein
MKKLALLAPLLLAGCAGIGHIGDTGPKTTADEKVVIGIETAFDAGSIALRLYADQKHPGAAELTKLRGIHDEAFRWVCRSRIAYNAANGIDLSTRVKAPCVKVLPEKDLTTAVSLKTATDQALSLVTALTASLSK